MSLSVKELQSQADLKRELQGTSPSKLENLAAALLSRLLNIPIALAKSGSQHGGDAGPAGRQGRRFRLECKRYSDNTPLSNRELLGEIDHALMRDEALEAWLLVATRDVPEQLEQDLIQKGEKIGVPVVIIDWKAQELASFAALCAFAPDLVESEISTKAEGYARDLQPVSSNAIEMLQHDLQSWSLGFETLRILSHNKLNDIWNSSRTSNAELGQNAASGAEHKKITRATVHKALNAWWHKTAQTDAPAAVIGWDGVGKTWATLGWLFDSKDEQPIILIVPSPAVAILSGVSETKVKEFLADRLYELSDSVRDKEHWLRRLEKLFKRPLNEGPVLTLFIDGLNQEPSVPWLPLLKVLQGKIFEGRIRVIISTRNHHFKDKLSKLRGLVVPAIPVTVDIYDTKPKGELDQMLAFENITQTDLHSDLIELARRPRLFKLVVKLRERLVDAGQITVHRLLWEYGRDTFGERAEKSFSETEWQDWLKEIAEKHLDGVRMFSVKSLGKTASRPDLSGNEVYMRLSDIIDGRFAESDASGSFRLTPTVVAHALGAALLTRIDTAEASDFDTLHIRLTQWLDPIAGLDQRSEILRAAVSILVQRGGSPNDSSAAGVLVTAWLQTQNMSDAHRQELANLAYSLTPAALLDVIEHSESHTHASARHWAVKALCDIPRSDKSALATIVMRAKQWFSTVSRDVNSRANANMEKNRADRFKQRIGIDASGPIAVAGINLLLVERANSVLQVTVPSFIKGFPLLKALPVFEMAAASLAVRGCNEGWDGLKWLCLLNETDPDETTSALRDLSEAVRLRKPEPGIHPALPARIASLLLWLTGQEQDEDTAASFNPSFDRWPSYEKDYLPQPGRNWFPLERQHANIVLNDTKLPLPLRGQRTRELWLDPDFEPSAAFVREVRAAAASIEVDKLNRHDGHTAEDHQFKEIEPILARCAPDLLADLMCRKMQGIATSPTNSRYWSAIHVTNHFLLTGKAESEAARTLRLSNTKADKNLERFAASRLMNMELQSLDAQDQIDTLIQADIDFIPEYFDEVLRIPTQHDVDTLIARYASGSPKQQNDLIIILSLVHPLEFSDNAWSWLENLAKQQDHELRHVIFQILACADELRFGRMLVAENWSWGQKSDVWVNHYGSIALIEATRGFPFDQVRAPRLAPWHLLKAARLRGSDPAEVRLAAEIFGRVLAAKKTDAFDPGASLSIDRTETQLSPFSFSVSPQPNQEGDDDLLPVVNPDEQMKAHRRAVEIANSRIREARASGASLYLADIASEDFTPVQQHAPDMIKHWLEGVQERTTDFQHRVHLAESAFLALCETLLRHDPEQGVQLWRALRETVRIRYIGVAGIEEFLHMIFRVPDSTEVITLREEWVECCYTDEALFNLAIAASCNGKADWLARVIEADRSSSLAWKRKRGAVLAGFTANNALPVAGAWPEGEIKTSHTELNRKSARFQWIEACAHHWWQVCLKAQDPAEAYAAWILFLRSADRRAWIWMRQDIRALDDGSEFFKLKQDHIQLNRSELKQAMKKRADKFDKNFLGRKIWKLLHMS